MWFVVGGVALELRARRRVVVVGGGEVVGSGWGRTSRPAVYISLTWRTPGRVTWGESSALIGALRPRRSDDDTRRGRRVWARRSTIG